MWTGILVGGLLAYLTRNALGTGLSAAISVFYPGQKNSGELIGLLAYLVAGGIGGVLARQAIIGATWSAFWTSRLGRFVIGRVAGTVVYGALLGPASILAKASMAAVLWAWFDIYGGRLGETILTIYMGGLAGLTAWLAWISRRRAKIFIGKMSRSARRLMRSLGMGSGGSARFAGLLEEWANAWKPGRILLGASMFDRHWLVGIEDDRHHSLIGSTRAGKGRDCIVGNILTWPANGSMVIVDAKAQNCAITAGAREAKGQTVAALDPARELDRLGLQRLRKRFNPLAGLDPKARDYAERVNLICDALIEREGGKNKFFDLSCLTLLAGGIDLLVKRGDPASCNLGALRDMMVAPEGPPIDELADAGGMARGAAALLSQGSEESVGNVMATVIAQTKWLDSPGAREMLSGSDFSLADLNSGRLTLYLIVPPQYLAEYARFLRLFVALTLAASIDAIENGKGEQATLFVLDEFYALGRLEMMSKAMGLLGGYGVRLYLVLQNLSQLQELYAENYQTFLANCGQTQVFATNDAGTADYFSKRLGQTMVWRPVKLQNGKIEYQPGARQLPA